MSTDDMNRDEGRLLPGDDQKRPPVLPSPLMSQRTLQWTSTRAPATSLSDALKAGLGAWPELEKGIRVIKVTTRGALKRRVITISQDKYALFVTHQSLKKKGGVLSTVARKLPLPMISRKGVVGLTNQRDLRERYVRYIDVADLDYVSHGVVGSQKLENSRRLNRLKGEDSMVDRERDKIVTIWHHGGSQTLDLLVSKESERKQLVECLQKMIEIYKEKKQTVSSEASLLRYIWYDVDVNQDGKIGEKEFIKILSRINFYIKNPSASFREFLKNKRDETEEGDAADEPDGLTYTEVMTLLQDLKNQNRKSIASQLWEQIFGQEPVVGATVFLEKFLQGVQGETDATMKDLERLFSVINGMEINVKNEPTNIILNRQISRERFEVLLHHQLNSAFDPWSLEMDEKLKLNKPMSQYWINTSHNTYLTGDQLQSNSSVEMYMKAMYRGCKCLELDCWDGEVRDGVCLAVVYHGHTLTSKILFADIIRVVKSYMDRNPDTYPIILSLENHCSHPFQLQIAEDLKEILGGYLYIPWKQDSKGALPSPERLRGKVVIKGKRPPEPDDAVLDDTVNNEDDDPYVPVKEVTMSKAASEQGEEEKKSIKTPKIVPELADLTLFHGAKFKSFGISILEPPSHMHSMSEPKITKIINKNPANSNLWREYNFDHMTRTYPAGSRVDSSNYNPILAWSLGCQLVALNFQSSDPPLHLNDGLFRQSAGCGYIVKPGSIMQKPTVESSAQPKTDETSTSKDETVTAADDNRGVLDMVMNSLGFEATPEVQETSTPAQEESSGPTVSGIKISDRMRTFQESLKDRVLPVRIKVRILSGSCLPKPMGEKTGETIDPYVTVSIHDVRKNDDGRLLYESSSHTTSTVQDNGFCPLWDEKKAKTFVVNSPQVAMLHFSLVEKDIALDDKVAEAAIPISLLRTGYRSIQLYDRNGTRTGPFGFATLLVEIQRFEII